MLIRSRPGTLSHLNSSLFLVALFLFSSLVGQAQSHACFSISGVLQDQAGAGLVLTENSLLEITEPHQGVASGIRNHAGTFERTTLVQSLSITIYLGKFPKMETKRSQH